MFLICPSWSMPASNEAIVAKYALNCSQMATIAGCHGNRTVQTHTCTYTHTHTHTHAHTLTHSHTRMHPPPPPPPPPPHTHTHTHAYTLTGEDARSQQACPPSPWHHKREYHEGGREHEGSPQDLAPDNRQAVGCLT